MNNDPNPNVEPTPAQPDPERNVQPNNPNPEIDTGKQGNNTEVDLDRTGPEAFPEKSPPPERH